MGQYHNYISSLVYDKSVRIVGSLGIPIGLYDLFEVGGFDIIVEDNGIGMNIIRLPS